MRRFGTKGEAVILSAAVIFVAACVVVLAYFALSPDNQCAKPVQERVGGWTCFGDMRER